MSTSIVDVAILNISARCLSVSLCRLSLRRSIKMPPGVSEHGGSAPSALKRTGQGGIGALLMPFADIMFSHFHLIFVLSQARPPSFLRNSRFAIKSKNGWERMLVKSIP